MKILIIRPYYGANISGDMIGDLGTIDFFDLVFPDLSLLATVSILRNLSHEVKFIDANAEKLLPDVVFGSLNEKFDMAIIKAVSPTMRMDVEFARCVKTLFPETKVVMTGRVAVLLRDWIKKNVPQIDFVADKNTEDYIYQLVTGNEKHWALDDFPIQDFSVSPYKSYHDPSTEPRAAIYTSRGCVLNCSYCPYAALHEGCYEERSLEKLGDDIQEILSLGIKKIQFRDQYFSCKKKRTLAVCDMIKKRGFKFSWACETKIDTLDKETVDAMIDAGMELICFGIETSSEVIHKKFHRPVSDFDKLKDFIQYINNKGVKTLGFYILGFPDEKWENMLATYDLACDMDTTYVNFNIWTPYIGTQSWKEYHLDEMPGPDIFPLFTNRMNVVSSNLMSFDKVEFVSDMFHYNRNFKKYGLESAYYEHHARSKAKKLYVQGYKKSKAFFESVLKDSKLQDEDFA